MTHPKPDRSKFIPKRIKTAENPAIDIGWNEGFLSDGRPYRVEMWAEDGISSLTFFIPAGGIEQLSNAQFVDLLEREKLLHYRPGAFRSAYGMPFEDASGNPVWSVNVVIGDETGTFVDDTVDILPYRS